MGLAVVLLPAAVAIAQAEAGAPPAGPCGGVEYRRLDFWVGAWDIEFDQADGSVGRAQNVITNDEYGRCVLVERFRLPGGAAGGGDYLGTSYSTYDKGTRSWRQMWVENGGSTFYLRGGPVVGQDHVFEFVTVEPRGEQNRIMRMIWQDVSANALIWKWQARQDDGSWKDQWVLRYRRRNAPN